MSIPSAADLFEHMRDAASQALAYIEGLAKEDFLADRRTQQAVTLNLIVLGEAATKLMDRHAELIADYPQIEWQAMRGMRNRIAHGYYEIDLDVVWDTVTLGLPELLKGLSVSHD